MGVTIHTCLKVANTEPIFNDVSITTFSGDGRKIVGVIREVMGPKGGELQVEHIRVVISIVEGELNRKLLRSNCWS